MAIVHSNNPAQREAAQTSEMMLQSDIGTARLIFLEAGSSPAAFPAYDAAVKAATVAHYSRLITAARANGIATAEFEAALRDLGATAPRV